MDGRRRRQRRDHDDLPVAPDCRADCRRRAVPVGFPAGRRAARRCGGLTRPLWIAACSLPLVALVAILRSGRTSPPGAVPSDRPLCRDHRLRWCRASGRRHLRRGLLEPRRHHGERTDSHHGGHTDAGRIGGRRARRIRMHTPRGDRWGGAAYSPMSARLHPREMVGGDPGRVRELDGLRGVAILLVVVAHATTGVWPAGRGLSHARFAPVGGGFVGVQLFFVLSGFLITTILVRERDRTHRIELARFYLRRLRRLLPALLVLLATFLVDRFDSLSAPTRSRVAVRVPSDHLHEELRWRRRSAEQQVAVAHVEPRGRRAVLFGVGCVRCIPAAPVDHRAPRCSESQ